MKQNPSTGWERIAADPRFHALIKRKTRFIVPSVLFFLAYYFSLPILVGYFPALMKRQVIGPLNLAYLFALSQFAMTWLMAWVYVRAANKFDGVARDVLKGDPQ
jgi:uncharacterized membrane protein (DUF485 family)